MKRFLGICMAALLLAGCAVQENSAAADEPYWEENKFDVEIYTGEFDGSYSENYLNREKSQYMGEYGKCTGDTAWLLAVDGGFVPVADIYTVKGKTPYVPLESLEPMGITVESGTDEYGYYALLKRGKDTLRLTPGRVAEKNGEKFETEDFLLEEMNGKMYVPLCFVAEQFGGKVQMIEDFKKEICGDDTEYTMKVSMAVVEMQERKPVFTVEDGTVKIQEGSAEEHRQTVELMKERGESFENFDPMAVHYKGMDLGRYSVYELEGFESLPIFFNRYTGEIYGVQPGLPIVSISNHFPNISWLF